MILLMYFYRSYFIYSTSLVEFRSRLQWFKPQNTGLKLFFTKIVFVAGSVDGGIKSLASIIFKNYNYLAERFDKISTWFIWRESESHCWNFPSSKPCRILDSESFSSGLTSFLYKVSKVVAFDQYPLLKIY